MSPVELVREIIGRKNSDRVGSEVKWSIDKVEELLRELNIADYEFDYEPKVVAVGSLNDLYSVMERAGKAELSDHCLMSMSKWRRKVCLHVGGWQFESEDTRN